MKKQVIEFRKIPKILYLIYRLYCRIFWTVPNNNDVLVCDLYRKNRFKFKRKIRTLAYTETELEGYILSKNISDGYIYNS